MTFQVSDYKRKNFLNLNDDNNLLIRPTYLKGSIWPKLIEHSNFLYTQAIRAITNHASIGKYCLIFFPKKPFTCLCRDIKKSYSI